MPTLRPHALEHVYWLGGSPCSGKSTIAAHLAQRHALRWYCCDDHLVGHARRADAVRMPELAAVGSLAWEAFFAREVAELLEDECRIYAHEFAMIVQDLLALGGDRPIVAEGAALMPALVAPWAAPGRALWLLPSEPFQRRIYPQRGEWVTQILAQCHDPALALERWLARDAAFARLAASQAQESGLPVLWVTGERPLAEIEALVEAHFGLGQK